MTLEVSRVKPLTIVNTVSAETTFKQLMETFRIV